MPHVLSLFTYQCPGQLDADRTPKTASEGGSLVLIMRSFLIKSQSLQSWFTFLFFVGGGGESALFLCLFLTLGLVLKNPQKDPITMLSNAAASHSVVTLTPNPQTS